MNTKNLETFIAVAKHGSIAAAAEAMFITPPALQQQLNRLEKELGFKLFERGPGGVKLTDAGELFLKGAQKIQSEMNHLLNRCKETAILNNCVRIGAIDGLMPDLFPRISGPFRQKYPHVIQKPMMENEEQLLADLDNGLLDAIEYYDCPRAHANDRCFLPLISEGRDCIMSANHPLAKRRKLTLADLKGQRMVVYRFDRIPGFREYVEKNYPEIALSEDAKITDYYSLIRRFEEGIVSLVPPHCEDQFTPLAVVPLELNMRWSVGLVYRANPSPVVQQFLDTAWEVFHM